MHYYYYFFPERPLDKVQEGETSEDMENLKSRVRCSTDSGKKHWAGKGEREKRGYILVRALGEGESSKARLREGRRGMIN